MDKIKGKVLACILLSMILLGPGCATIDFDAPKSPSNALTDTETRDTPLGRTVLRQTNGYAQGQSGFRLLNESVESMALRLAMAKHATKTIDAQYYLITDDEIGYAFIGALLEAADRGVRVRLLVDDIQTQGYDLGMATLDTHPHFEIRVFNPFAHRQARALDVFQFSRINRRMHNKSFTADNQISIIGGRNIASEYFGAREDVNFGDLDIAGIGPVVREVSTMFDQYWNSKAAVPVAEFASAPNNIDERMQTLRSRIQGVGSDSTNAAYIAAFRSDYDDLIETQLADFKPAEYRLVYDSPSKAKVDQGPQDKNITADLAQAIDKAEQDFILISPYFVPLNSGEKYLQKLIDRGLDIKVITNSLSANNHAIVHSGYAPSRKTLLEMGVELYEVKALGINQQLARVGNENSRATLHTKAFILDRQKLFIGSFNWDPRSMNINTELGIVIDSATLGAEFLDGFSEKLVRKTYQVELDEDNDLRWVDRGGLKTVYFHKEPDTSWWQRFKAGFMRILPGKSQL